MVLALESLLIIIFVVLSVVHFYWAFGGKWGIDSALPTNEDGVRVLNPRAIESAIVGVGLLLFAIFYLVRTGVLSITLPSWLILYAGWILPSIFLLRVIGDFKYVGLFKKLKSTKFAKKDTRYFIPLCAFLAAAAFLVQKYSYYET